MVNLRFFHATLSIGRAEELQHSIEGHIVVLNDVCKCSALSVCQKLPLCDSCHSAASEPVHHTNAVTIIASANIVSALHPGKRPTCLRNFVKFGGTSGLQGRVVPEQRLRHIHDVLAPNATDGRNAKHSPVHSSLIASHSNNDPRLVLSSTKSQTPTRFRLLTRCRTQSCSLSSKRRFSFAFRGTFRTS